MASVRPARVLPAPHAAASAPPLADPSAAVCRNCGAALVGPFCHQCGQTHLTGRLTVRMLLKELRRRVIDLDRGFVHTAVDLTLRPGGVVHAYVAGRRRQYTNPFSYLFVATGFSVVVMLMAWGEIAQWFRDELTRNPEAFGFLSEMQVAALERLMFDLTPYTVYLTLATMSVPFALMMRLLFRKSGYNLAELSVFTLFAFGHIALLCGFSYLLIPLFENGVALVLQIGAPLIHLLVVTHAAVGFFGGRFGTIAKSALALVVAYAFASLTLVAGMLFYVLTFVS